MVAHNRRCRCAMLMLVHTLPTAINAHSSPIRTSQVCPRSPRLLQAVQEGLPAASQAQAPGAPNISPARAPTQASCLRGPQAQPPSQQHAGTCPAAAQQFPPSWCAHCLKQAAHTSIMQPAPSPDTCSAVKADAQARSRPAASSKLICPWSNGRFDSAGREWRGQAH